jgi:hypothetical protein
VCHRHRGGLQKHFEKQKKCTARSAAGPCNGCCIAATRHERQSKKKFCGGRLVSSVFGHLSAGSRLPVSAQRTAGGLCFDDMSLGEFCINALQIPASEHYGWRGALVFFQTVCFCIYLAATVMHRARLFVPAKQRRWDLDHVFMVMSTAAAASAVVTWSFWMENNAASVRVQAAKEAKNLQQFAYHRGTQWTDNAVYLIVKPITIALCVFPPSCLCNPRLLIRFAPQICWQPGC